MVEERKSASIDVKVDPTVASDSPQPQNASLNGIADDPDALPGAPSTARDDVRHALFDERTLEPAPEFSEAKWAELVQFATKIRDSSESLDGLRALCYAITRKTNAAQFSFDRLAKSMKEPWWPKQFPKISEDAIKDFSRGISKLQNPTRIISLYYVLSALHDVNHQCFEDYIVKTIMASGHSFTDFQRILINPEIKNPSTISLSRIRSLGAALYRFLAQSGLSSISNVLETPLFFGLTPAQNESDIDKHVISSLRYGATGQFVGSSLKFTFLKGDASINSYLFIRTYYTDDNGYEHLRSHGFVICYKSEVYFIQYHKNGEGLNVIATPLAQLQLVNDRSYYKGLVLALDLQGTHGPLASRTVLYNDYTKINPISGEVRREAFVKQLSQRSGSANDDREWEIKAAALSYDIMAYLRDDTAALVKPIDAKGQNYIAISRWAALKNYIENSDISKYIDESEDINIDALAASALKI